MFKLQEDEYQFLDRICANIEAIEEDWEDEELPDAEDFDSKADRLYDEQVAREINEPRRVCYD